MIRSCRSATAHRARTAAGGASVPVGLSGSVMITERTGRPAARAAVTVRASSLASGTPAEPDTKCAERAGQAGLRGVADPARPGHRDVAADRRHQAEQQGLAARPAHHRVRVGGQAAPVPVPGGGFPQHGAARDRAVGGAARGAGQCLAQQRCAGSPASPNAIGSTGSPRRRRAPASGWRPGWRKRGPERGRTGRWRGEWTEAGATELWREPREHGTPSCGIGGQTVISAVFARRGDHLPADNPAQLLKSRRLTP